MVEDRDGLHELDSRILGTERYREREPLTEEDLEGVAARSCRAALADLTGRGQHEMARVVLRFLHGLADVMEGTARALRPGGRALVKIAPSRVRGAIVPCHLACAELLALHGVKLTGVVDDSYDATSRSLTSARNWYSGRMDSDHLLLFRKDGR